ncbi:MAG: hypothetical protein HFE63_01295 [Clostridiales bacterium]|nr:hypothetical protein [Clostridiales bacterium]
MAFTFDDVKRKISENGLYMSDADLQLAERNPDAGMSLVNYKLDYNGATTDEARALINRGAEQVRSNYGGYTGGEEGSGYYLTSPSPSSFYDKPAPTYDNKWQDKINSGYDKLTNYGSFNYDKPAPTYNDTYAGKRNELIESLTNPKEFSWDKDTDPAYQAYAKQYAREGKRAVDDTMAAASAQSGGIPSSYAVTAASQAGNYYSSQMADKIPELYENAYNRYLAEFQKQKEALSAVQGESQNEYDRYLSERSLYNNDRNFAYQQYMDEYDRIGNELSTAGVLEQMDYSKYLNELGQYNTDRDFRYQQLLDTIANNQYNDERDYQRAMDAAGYLDYTFLNKLGVDTSKQEARDALSDEYSRLQLGSEYANQGDFTYLDNLGVDTSNARIALEASQRGNELQMQLLEQQIENAKAARNDDAYSRQLELAKLAAAQGDFKPLRALGINVTEAEKAWNASYDQSAREYSAGELYTAQKAYENGKASAEQIDMLLNSGYLTPDTLYGSKVDNGISYTDGQLLEAYDAYKDGKATADQYDILITAGLVDPNMVYAGGGAADPEYEVAFEGGAPMSREEWYRRKNNSAYQAAEVRDYDTYDEYLEALKKYNMEGLIGGNGAYNVLPIDVTKKPLYQGGNTGSTIEDGEERSITEIVPHTMQDDRKLEKLPYKAWQTPVTLDNYLGLQIRPLPKQEKKNWR